MRKLGLRNMNEIICLMCPKAQLSAAGAVITNKKRVRSQCEGNESRYRPNCASEALSLVLWRGDILVLLNQKWGGGG